jgi:hypothetical protein
MIFRKRERGPAGPEGVAIRVRPSAIPERERAPDGRRIPRRLAIGLMLAAAFYVVAHLVIVRTVWPVHGTSPGAGAVLLRDAVSLVGWLLLFPVLRMLGYRGSWAVVALPVMIFLLTRPTLFQLFTDPAYQARAGTRAEANLMKAERSRLTTVMRAYDEERQQIVFDGEAPASPTRCRSWPRRPSASAPIWHGSAPRSPWWSPRSRSWSATCSHAAGRASDGGASDESGPSASRWASSSSSTLFFTELGKVAGTTPWELFLPVFVFAWAATLGDDAYNLARPDQVVAPRRVLSLVLFGAMPVVPFLVIRELGLSVVLAGSMATMLLVGTRRGWWAGLMMVVWTTW